MTRQTPLETQELAPLPVEEARNRQQPGDSSRRPTKLLNRNFLIQLQGQTVSRLGTQLFTIAMVAWIKDATGSATIMGVLTLVAGLPAIFLLPIGGALADRRSRKRIIILSDLLRGLAVSAVAFLLFSQPDAVGVILAGLFVVAVFNGIVNAFFSPAIGATIPDLVPTEQVTAANSLGQLSIQVSLFVGTALGGVLYRLVGAPMLFFLNGLSFLYASASETLVQIPQRLRDDRPEDWRGQLRSFKDDLAEGLRYVWRRPGLREMVLMSAILSFFTAPVLILLIFFVEDFLQASTDWYGFLLAGFGIGTLLGYVFAGITQFPGRTRGRFMMAMILTTTVGYTLLGLVRTPGTALFLTVIGGFASGYVVVNITTLVQVTTPSEIRGRVVGLLAAISTSLTPIAGGLAGVTADLVDQNIPLIYVACGVIMSISALVLSTNRAFRNILSTDPRDLPVGESGAAWSAATVGDASPGAAPVPGNPGHAAVQAPGDPGHPETGTSGERTRDVYEQIDAYPKPPMIPVPTPEELDGMLSRLGQPRGGAIRLMTDAVFAGTGFKAFLAELPPNLEHLLRTTNLRLPGLYTPVIAATLALADDSRELDPFTRAATLVFGVRSLYDDLSSGRLPPDTYRGEVLEMGQYPNLFATSQIIEQGRPRVFKSSNLSQITVIASGRFYVLQVGTPGVDCTVEQLAAALGQIAGQAQRDGADGVGPGIVTAAAGLTQLRAFAALQQVEVNRRSLQALRHSLCTVCLDLDTYPETPSEVALWTHTGNPDNRWYHASLQLVVFGNARAACICNFTTYLDGNTMMRSGAEIQRRGAACGLQEPAAGAGPAPAVELAWQIPPQMKERARLDFQRVRDDQQATFEIDAYGRERFEELGLPPVPGFLLALQLASNRLVGRPARITQFLTMSRYRCMDLTTAMISTPEAMHFADYLAQGQAEVAHARALAEEAIAAQIEVQRQARQFLPLPTAITLFLRSHRGLGWTLREGLMTLRAKVLIYTKAVKDIEREVLVSHPEIYPEIPIVGRPGVRLPYVKYYGLHYQIFPDRIVITMMPGMAWEVPNERFVEELRASLDQVAAALNG